MQKNIDFAWLLKCFVLPVCPSDEQRLEMLVVEETDLFYFNCCNEPFCLSLRRTISFSRKTWPRQSAAKIKQKVAGRNTMGGKIQFSGAMD